MRKGGGREGKRKRERKEGKKGEREMRQEEGCKRKSLKDSRRKQMKMGEGMNRGKKRLHMETTDKEESNEKGK